MISFETSPLVDCIIYSTMGLNNVCRLSDLNISATDMSDLYSVQFDIRNCYGYSSNPSSSGFTPIL